MAYVSRPDSGSTPSAPAPASPPTGPGVAVPVPPLELVTQHGNVRRTLFHSGYPRPAETPAAPAPEPYMPPAPPAPSALPEASDQAAPAAPSERSPIYSIHDEIDRLGARTTAAPTLASTTPVGTRVASSVIYRTPHGAVSETRVSDGERERRMLYLTRRDGEGREHTERFNSRMVDPLIKDVNLSETATTTETVTEYVTQERLVDAPDSVSSADARTMTDRDYLPVRRADASDGLVTDLEATGTAWEPETAVVQPTPTPTHAPTSAAARAPRRHRARTVSAYEGDDHPVLEIEGIGETLARRLERAGIATTSRLYLEDADTVADEVGVPTKTVRTWQAMCDLIKVKGIGKQYAEALARAGVKDIDDLKGRKAANIATSVAKYLASLDSHVLGTSVTEARIEAWQKAARTMRKHKVTVEPRT